MNVMTLNQTEQTSVTRLYVHLPCLPVGSTVIYKRGEPIKARVLPEGFRVRLRATAGYDSI